MSQSHYSDHAALPEPSPGSIRNQFKIMNRFKTDLQSVFITSQFTLTYSFSHLVLKIFFLFQC